jgi:XTP/dITP diphosphohydrolase
MAGTRELVLCTGNPGKVSELRAMLPKEWVVLSLADVGLGGELPENGHTLEDNALEKARFVHAICGKPCLADDTGLEVDALDGAPGVYSARYAGPEGDAAANIRLLLRSLEGEPDRSARFRTVLALVGRDGEHLFEGVVSGRIAMEPVGSGGFGYDPLFIPDGCRATFAEMGADEKNAIGHRGKALARLIKALGAP